MFDKLNIKRFYRTSKDNLDQDLFIPLLSNSTKYDRGTGFFSVQGLAAIAKGIIPYVKNGGIIRLVTSIELDLTEIEVIVNGLHVAETKLTNQIEQELECQLEYSEEVLGLDLITNMIASGKLQIKIAYLPNGGIYHEKIAYLEDEVANTVWLTGSNNETYNGLKKNVESVVVLKSWTGDRQDILEQKYYFDSLWNNREEGIEVFSFPEAMINKLFSLYKKSDDLDSAINKLEEFYLSKSNPSVKKLYPYQEVAIQQFKANKYCHFFEMATGTGKTFTAVKAVQQLFSDMQGLSLYAVVVVPQIDLQMQWKKAFEECGISAYLFGGNSTNKDWEEELSRGLIQYHNNSSLVVSICVYDTFFAKVLSNIENQSINKIIIVDEAHELSPNQINKLPHKFKFRLGLSATPERHNKTETDEIINYFTKGNIETYKYSIEEAINNGFLSRYKYHPIPVHLRDEDSEFGNYKKYTIRLIQLLNAKERDIEAIQDVLNKRSVIVKKAKAKTDMIEKMVRNKRYDFKNSVIYCGQGKDVESEELIIDDVTRALDKLGSYRVSQFTSRTVDRDLVLKEFENGYYDTLVAIKCFDQGVDVPKLDKIYIMASDSLNRQTIQRRGRVLRKCKETGKEIAYIYDMVTLPPDGILDEVGASQLVAKELKRVKEYGRLSENKEDVSAFINDLEQLYSIGEESYEEENDE